MEVVSLGSLIEASTEESRDVMEYLLSFSCSSNKSVEDFLHNTAIENEKSNRTRTSLVIDTKNDNEIIGYFTITVKIFEFVDVSKTIIKRLTGNKNEKGFPTILIAQLGRSDLYKGKVEGSKILDLALVNCKTVYEIAALRVICVEYEDTPFLHNFYLANNFNVLQTNSDNDCIIAYLRLI